MFQSVLKALDLSVGEQASAVVDRLVIRGPEPLLARLLLPSTPGDQHRA
jgi:hypothetical protein